MAGCQGRNSQLAGHGDVSRPACNASGSRLLSLGALSGLSEMCIQISDRFPRTGQLEI